MQNIYVMRYYIQSALKSYINPLMHEVFFFVVFRDIAEDLFVYRLIDATLIENFLRIASKIKIKILVNRLLYWTLCTNGLICRWWTSLH